MVRPAGPGHSILLELAAAGHATASKADLGKTAAWHELSGVKKCGGLCECAFFPWVA